MISSVWIVWLPFKKIEIKNQKRWHWDKVFRIALKIDRRDDTRSCSCTSCCFPLQDRMILRKVSMSPISTIRNLHRRYRIWILVLISRNDEKCKFVFMSYKPGLHERGYTNLKELMYMMTSPNRNMFCVTGPLWGEPTGGFPSQRPVARSFDIFFDLRQNKRVSKQSIRWWFETSLRSLWRFCHVIVPAYNQSHYAWPCRNPG